jgi:hypothetical protein
MRLPREKSGWNSDTENVEAPRVTCFTLNGMAIRQWHPGQLVVPWAAGVGGVIVLVLMAIDARLRHGCNSSCAHWLQCFSQFHSHCSA